MAWKCGNCNIEFTKAEQVARHMLLVHESDYDPEADPKLADHQQKLKGTPEYVAARKLFGGQ